jgi:hypothetical protein
MRGHDERGVALLLVILMLLVVSAMAAGMALDATTEIGITANHRDAVAALYAADAVMTRALADLAVANANDVLAGTARSTFIDGAPAGIRHLADGSTIDLTQVCNRATCGKPTGCSPLDITALTDDRPWGVNNPIWRLYAYGPVGDLADGLLSPYYVVVMVADDPSENDGDPLHDGVPPLNPGAGLLEVRAVAFGPGGARQAVDATVSAADSAHLRSWRTALP